MARMKEDFRDFLVVLSAYVLTMAILMGAVWLSL
jgi:hypothetical protein